MGQNSAPLVDLRNLDPKFSSSKITTGVTGREQTFTFQREKRKHKRDHRFQASAKPDRVKPSRLEGPTIICCDSLGTSPALLATVSSAPLVSVPSVLPQEPFLFTPSHSCPFQLRSGMQVFCLHKSPRAFGRHRGCGGDTHSWAQVSVMHPSWAASSGSPDSARWLLGPISHTRNPIHGPAAPCLQSIVSGIFSI